MAILTISAPGEESATDEIADVDELHDYLMDFALRETGGGEEAHERVQFALRDLHRSGATHIGDVHFKLDADDLDWTED